MEGQIDKIRIDLQFNSPKAAASKITEIVNALEDLNDVGKRLNFKKIDEAFSSIAYLANSNVGRLANNLDKVALALVRFNQVADTLDMGRLETAFQNLANSVNSWSAETADRIKNAAEALSRYRSLRSAILNGENEGARAVSVFADPTKGAGDADKIVKQTGELGTNADRASRSMQTLGETARNAFRAMGSIAGNGAKGLVKGFKMVGSAVADLAKKIGSTLNGALKTFGQTTFGKLKRFISQVKRILLYRLIKDIIKGIKDAFKTGMENMYYYSQEVGTQFAKSMDMIATSMLYLKNSIGAMVAPIVNNLAPVIDMMTDKFVDFLNIVNQVIATLSGADTWTKAIKYPTQYKEATDAASKANKKFKATILAIDEINPLNDNSDNGKGSGKDALDYSKMFEEQQLVANKWTDIANNIKNAFKKKDFVGIGNNIGTWLKQGLDGKNWKAVGEKIAQIPQDILDTLKGIIETPGFFDSIGTSLSDTLSGIVNTAKLNAPKNGETMGNFLNGVVTTVKNFFKDKSKFKTAGEALNETLTSMMSTIKEDEIGEALGGVLNGALAFASGLIGDDSQFGEKVSTALKKFTTGIQHFIESVNWDLAGQVISDGFVGAINGITDFMTSSEVAKFSETFVSAIIRIIKNINWDQVVLALLKNILASLTTFPLELLAGALSAIGKELGLGFLDDVGKWLAGGLDTVNDYIFGEIDKKARELGIDPGTLGKTPSGRTRTPSVGGTPSTTSRRGAGLNSQSNPLIDGIVETFSTALSEGGKVGGLSFISEATKSMSNEEAKKKLDEADKAVLGFIEKAYGKGGEKSGLEFVQTNKDGMTSEKAKKIWEETKAQILKYLNMDDGAEKNGQSYGKKFADAVAYSINHKGMKVDLLGDESGLLKASVTARASGGIVNSGQLFLAGEAGPEMVGNIGKKTAVANTSQMVDAIAGGVAMADAEGNALLREQNNLLRALVAKEMSVEITTSGLTSALRRNNQVAGRTLVPVGG